MSAALLILLIKVAVPILHLYTFFTEATHLNHYKNHHIILLLLLTGTLFIYFVSPTARNKGLMQIGLIASAIFIPKLIQMINQP